MAIYRIVFFLVLSHIGVKSSRILTTLYAIDLGADSLVIGFLISMYGLFPLLLAVSAGKVSDRFGFRYPSLLGLSGVSLGLLLPYLIPRLTTLFFSVILIGTSFIFCQVSFHNLIGALSETEERTRNYSIMSLGAATSSFICPLIAGFSIDHLGYVTTYLYLSLISMFAGAVLFIYSKRLPAINKNTDKHLKRNVTDLIKNAPLRRTLITSGIVITGVDLYSFYFPIYGHSIGFSASLIGVVLSLYAAAAFVIRIAMPFVVKRYNEEKVLTFSLFLSGATFFLFPFSENVLTLSLISFIIGLGLGCGQPLSIILTYNRAPAGRSGEALGARITINKFIQLIVPIFFGSLGNVFGLFPVFWSNALLLLGGGYMNNKRENRSLSARFH